MWCMIRAIVCIGTSLVLVPSSAGAQVDVSVHGGIHFDRSDRPDRFLVTGDGARIESTRGEATVWGGRGTYWVRPVLGLQADVSRSDNESWSGSSPVPPPTFATTTTYISVRGAIRTNPDRRVQAMLAAGPALMVHGGTGTSYLARTTDPGGVIELGGRIRIAGRLGVQIVASNFLYISRYDAALSSSVSIGGSDSEFRHDLLILPGLSWSW